VGLLVMLVLAAAFFGLSFFAYGFALAAYLFTLFLFGIALGVFASGLVLRLGPAAEWFIWPIPALLSPFAGVFYPVSTLPAWMQIVSRALPPSYVFEAVRSVASGHGAATEMLARATILSAIYLALACWWFAWIYRRAVRTGLIARFSAESLT